MIDPSQAPAAPAAPAPQVGTVVCIAPQGDGSFVVETRNEPNRDNPIVARKGGQTAPDIEQALELARQMLTAGGEGQSDQSDLEAQANALFEGGFNQASGRTPPPEAM